MSIKGITRVLNALMVIMALVIFVVPAASAFQGTASQKNMDVRHWNFSKAEIADMAKARAIIKTSLGDIKLKFFPESAPNHVNNFIELAKAGFYDGTVFHRVIPGFMIQGGDPESKSPNRARHGLGGPPYLLKAEFNDRSHKRGTLSMARKGHPDSAGSQFFICVADSPWLDRQYTVFGEVVSGMEVVDKIVNQPRDARDNPHERIEIKVSIIESEPEKSVEPEAKKEPVKVKEPVAKEPVKEPEVEESEGNNKEDAAPAAEGGGSEAQESESSGQETQEGSQ